MGFDGALVVGLRGGAGGGVVEEVPDDGEDRACDREGP